MLFRWLLLISVIGRFVYLAALLPAWHSGYVLGVLKYKYHPFLPTISFSPPHQGIAYHNLPSTSHPFANRFYQHTSNFFSSNFIEITSKKNKKPPFHLPYHTTPHIIHNGYYSFLNPFFCRSFDNSTSSPKPPQVFFWTSFFSITLWVGFWTLSPPPEATWTYAWLRPWRNARNEHSSTLVQWITRQNKSRNLSQKLRWKGGRTYRWGIGP